MQTSQSLPSLALDCPACNARGSITQALRIEIEAELSVTVVECSTCRSLFDARPRGAKGRAEPSPESLRIVRVECPNCGVDGHSVQLDLGTEAVEEAFLTSCEICGHAFAIDRAGRANEAPVATPAS